MTKLHRRKKTLYVTIQTIQALGKIKSLFKQVRSGELKEEPTSEEEPTTEEEPTSEEEPTAEEEPTSEEEPTTEEEPTSEEEPTAEEEPTSEEEPGELAATLAEVAEANEVELPALLSQMTHEIEVDGEKKTFSLAEIIEGYTGATDVAAQTEALETERSTFQEHAEEAKQSYIRQAASIQEFLTSIDKGLAAALETPDMVTLKSEDPSKYLLQKDQIDSQRRMIKEQIGSLNEQFDQGLALYKQNKIKEHTTQLTKDIKGWNDAMADETVKMYQALGFNDSEIVELWDHRLVKVIRDVNTLRAENKTLKERAAKAKTVAKTVKKKVPKTVKPAGDKTTTVAKSNKKVLDLRKRVKENDSNENVANLLTAIRKAG